jgi:hypothetical protein
MNHAIITRINLEDDIAFNNYFELMKSVYFPSLHQQTNKNFHLLICVRDMHRFFIKTELEKYGIKNYSLFSRMGELKSNAIKFDVQTRQDCDDYMGPTYIEKIQNTYSENKDKYESFIVYAVGTKYDLKSKKEYYIPDAENPVEAVNTTRCAGMGFISVCQKTPQFWIHQAAHQEMFKLIPRVVIINEYGLVRWVIHDHNKMGKIYAVDVPRKIRNCVELFFINHSQGIV